MVASYQLFVLILIQFGLIVTICDARRGNVHKNRTRHRIIDGVEASPGEFPDHIGLLIPTDTNLNGICGGVLLKPDMVLTANHCVREIPQGKYVLALNSEFAPDSWSNEERKKSLRVVHVCPSEGYWHIAYRHSYDYAILRLESKFETYKTGVIAEKPLREGRLAIAVGFGVTDFNTDNPDDSKSAVKLRKLDMEPVNCEEYDSGNSHVCFTSKKGGDVCYGDSGSPVYNEDHEVLAVSSYGVPEGICRHNYKSKSVFSDAVWYKDNIDQLIEDCEEKPMPSLPPRDDL